LFRFGLSRSHAMVQVLRRGSGGECGPGCKTRVRSTPLRSIRAFRDGSRSACALS